ncbi:hypothetical protein Scep_019311 [Stephania cephalantha]|uniref:Uncharacterized protein n=1 Tax=Stephania cephalantha TaxID=152367 RepID=A0AAP0IAT4_9MAGN
MSAVVRGAMEEMDVEEGAWGNRRRGCGGGCGGGYGGGGRDDGDTMDEVDVAMTVVSGGGKGHRWVAMTSRRRPSVAVAMKEGVMRELEIRVI